MRLNVQAPRKTPARLPAFVPARTANAAKSRAARTQRPAPAVRAATATPTATEEVAKPSTQYYSTADPRLSGAAVKEVLGLFELWNSALASGDPTKVADLYASDGILLPTVSNSVRSTREGLVDYFTNFLKLQPQGVIDEYGIRQESVDADGASAVISNSGIYTFTFGANGKKVQARFTYVYKKVDGEWKILSHHSSQLPSQLAPTPFKGEKKFAQSTSDDQMTGPEEAGVLAAFEQWNAALKTLDPDAVTAMYAPDAILLPTVSDDVRTTKEGRRDYFVEFLKKQPEGALDEHHIRLIGRDALGLPCAASNQGIYTFELKATGQKVKARYTYNYVRDGTRWLIKKHHSSAMPEAEEKEYYSTADPRLSGTAVKEVLGLFEKWNGALASGDPTKVADLYASNGVLLPTVSNCVRSTREGLVDYFTNFLKLQPQGVIDEYGIREEAVDADGNSSVISNSGLYTFTFGANGKTVQARFTYVYQKVEGEWKILSHHSSQLPSQLAPTPFKGKAYLSSSTSDDALTKAQEEGVLKAFEEWNAALKTLDPERVIELYAPDAILLPTVSDDVRTTKDGRRKYFVDFLKKQPQGSLDEHHIRLIGRDSLGLPNAVSNQGIYTFELGSTGQKVQARFTYNYVRDGSRWLIKKHHSSAMPETTSA